MRKDPQKPTPGSARVLVSFDSQSRASAYARALAAQVKSATFRSNRLADGKFGGEMLIAGAGLTTSDATLLTTLGARGGSGGPPGGRDPCPTRGGDWRHAPLGDSQGCPKLARRAASGPSACTR